MLRTYIYSTALCGFFGLFLLLMAWPTLLQPTTLLPVALLLIIGVGPLLIPFKGLMNHNLKSCTWMSYLSLPYFIHGVTEAYVNPELRLYALMEVLFSLMLCFGAGFYVYTAKKA